MLHLFQSNRLETLLELLAAMVGRPQRDPLAAETVIVQSKGMGRWVSLRLAAKHGVCANLRFSLPASFLWELLRAVLGDLPHRSAFSPETMVFRLMGWLSAGPNLERVPSLEAYLRGGDDLRRYELARNIADLFDQYLVYRPDWIGAWEQGTRLGLGPNEDWQALLWREMAASTDEPHRVRLVQRLLQTMGRQEARNRLPERLALFGVSSLPPVFLQIVKQLSLHIDVALFALNPCRMPWGEILDRREIDRLAGGEPPEESHLYEGNALLASLGKQGREFFDALLDETPEIHDVFDEAEAGSLLQNLQGDVLDLVDGRQTLTAFADPATNPPAGFPVRERRLIARHDRSLQIHVCHSPMREVEVLRDQILAMLDADPTLTPSDIAVLAPKIATYAPYIEAVFASAENPTRIPFAIADRRGCDEKPVLDIFLRLLDLPASRFEADWLLDFMEQDFVRNRFELDEGDIAVIHHWVRETGIRWGRDAFHRAALGLPAESRHSWRDGLCRLMVGYALPKAVANGGVPLFGDILPFDDLEGTMALAMGRFAEFAETLMELAARMQTARPLDEWADLLGDMIESLFAPASEDQNEDCQRLRDTLDRLRELAGSSRSGQAVDLTVVKRWMAEQFDGESGGGFLTGGVTFCAMVPMRSLPFRVICLLGMNDGAFPRSQRPSGFDLIARHPRRGDRSRRLDDRYLFLETLISARQVLYISHMGRNIRDNGELPPSVLVTDLLDLVKACFVMEDGTDCLQHIVTTHPLQAFNPLYFRGDPDRPGYSAHWLAAARLLGAGTRSSSPLFEGPLPEPEEAALSIDLADLSYFFSNPARYLLRNRLGVFLHAGEDVFENREPFELDHFKQEELRLLAMEEIAGRLPVHAAWRLAEASGALPHGGFGKALFDRQHALARKAAPHILPLLDTPRLEPLPLRFEAHGVVLEGTLTGITHAGLIEWRLQAIGPRDLFNLWIRHLALCLLRPKDVECRSVLIGENQQRRLSPVENAADELGKLLGYFRQGLSHPLGFFVKSGWAYLEAEANNNRDAGLKAAHKAWDIPAFRNGNLFGESENPYYQAAYRGSNPLDETFEKAAADILGPLRSALEGS